MTLENVIAAEINQIHEYVRLTGSLAVQWFFFAATINAAIAALINQKDVKLPGGGRYIAALFVLCDIALVLGFAVYLPVFYGYEQWQINDLTNKLPGERSSSAFPVISWIVLSYIIAANYFAMAYLWWRFYPTNFSDLKEMVVFLVNRRHPLPVVADEPPRKVELSGEVTIRRSTVPTSE